MKTFECYFVGTFTEDNSSEEDENAIDIVSDSHPHGDQQLVGYSNVIRIVTKEDNSDEEDEMEIAASESQSPHGKRQPIRKKCSNSELFYLPYFQLECGKIRTRKTLNMDTFHVVNLQAIPIQIVTCNPKQQSTLFLLLLIYLTLQLITTLKVDFELITFISSSSSLRVIISEKTALLQRNEEKGLLTRILTRKLI